MTDTTQPQPFIRPFDERSALEELEQLADKIQRSRRQREEKVAEFDAFVRGFRQDRYAASIAASERELRRAEDRPSAPHAATHAATHAARGVAAPTDAAAVASTTATPASPPAMPWSVTAASEPALASAVVRPEQPRAAYIGVSIAALAVVIVGVMLWRSAGTPDTPASPSTAAVPAGSTAQAPPTPSAPAITAPAPAAAIPAGPPRALNVEFVTVRPVWARITVDGRRAMEREFKADQRFPFGADRAIVVRAGDAGAIRLIVDGKDLGVLGRDGQVFERVFTPR